MLTKLSEARTRHLVILGLPTVFIVGGLLTFHLGGIKLTLSVLGLLTLGAVLIAWFFRPRWWGSTRVQAISVLVFGGLVMAAFADTFWLPWVTDLYAGLRGRFADLPALSLPNSVPYWFRLAALVLTALVFILVNRVAARRPVLPPPDLAPDRPFPDKGYETLRDEFCTYMRGQLDQYDTELNWSDSDYSTLEAEVEADRHGVRRPRVERDLVDAIRRDRQTRAFLLLGDPGSGKSVSLRRLCRRLYAEVPGTGIVPVYVNLRDWHGTAEPGDEEIQAFIREYLKRSAGRAGKRFLDTWFDPMLADGRFFFLLDSFDEMPSVLDCDDADSRIKTISHAFDRFFHDLHGCRGVLASRRFRQPRGFRGRRLSIRPFKESQIRAAMRRWLQGQALDADQLVRTLFRDRPELVPALRNPFLADLIAHYLIQHQGALPPSHFAIYQDYLETRLAEDAPDLRAHGLDQDAVMDAATRIAWTMYANPDVGLEVDKRELGALVQMERLNDLIEALRMARIVRVGGIRAQRLSFVHRRFAEFFVVRAMLAADDPLPIDSIPEDSRWRDCLALYCGVAPVEKVQPIADYCWRIIEGLQGKVNLADPREARSAIHCVRFLRDGFSSRPQVTERFREQLDDVILQWLQSGNLLAARVATDALGLLSEAARNTAIVLAFKFGGPWIRESTMLASRHTPGLGSSGKNAIRAYLRGLSTKRMISDFRDLDFGFSLTEEMRDIRLGLRLDLVSLAILWTLPWVFIDFLWLDSYPDRFGLAGLLLFSACAFESSFYFLGKAISAMPSHAAIPISVASPPFDGGYTSRSESSASGPDRPIWRLGFDSSLRFAILGVLLMPTMRFANGLAPAFEWRWVVVLALIATPWEFYSSLFTATRVLASSAFKIDVGKLVVNIAQGCSRITARGSLVVLVTAILSGSALFLVDTLTSGYFLIHVPAEGKEWQKQLYFIMVGSTLLLFVAWSLSRRFADAIKLNQLKVPDDITRAMLYEVCCSIKTSRARLRYIEALRLQGARVIGEYMPIPTSAWVSRDVAEALVRLEMQWAGMEE